MTRYKKIQRQEIKLYRELDRSRRLLMIRAQIGWLIQTMDDKAKDGVQCADMLRRFINRVFDPMLCNNDCKGMYFCTKEIGHKGVHSEDGLLYWHEDQAIEDGHCDLSPEERQASAAESVAYMQPKRLTAEEAFSPRWGR